MACCLLIKAVDADSWADRDAVPKRRRLSATPPARLQTTSRENHQVIDNNPTRPAAGRGRRLMLAGTSPELLRMIDRYLLGVGHATTRADLSLIGPVPPSPPPEALLFVSNRIDRAAVQSFAQVTAGRDHPVLCIVPMPDAQQTKLLDEMPADELVFAPWGLEEIVIRVERLFRRRPIIDEIWQGKGGHSAKHLNHHVQHAACQDRRRTVPSAFAEDRAPRRLPAGTGSVADARDVGGT